MHVELKTQPACCPQDNSGSTTAELHSVLVVLRPVKHRSVSTLILPRVVQSHRIHSELVLFTPVSPPSTPPPTPPPPRPNPNPIAPSSPSSKAKKSCGQSNEAAPAGKELIKRSGRAVSCFEAPNAKRQTAGCLESERGLEAKWGLIGLAICHAPRPALGNE